MEDRWMVIKHIAGEEFIHINSLSRISRSTNTKITFYPSGNIITGLELTFSSVIETENTIKSIDSRMDPKAVPPPPIP